MVLVDSFDDQEDSADFEESAAYESGDAAGGAGFVGEVRTGVGDGQPVKEAAHDEDCTADGEEEGHEEADVPPGEGGEHASDALQYRLWGVGRRWGVRSSCIWDDQRMSAWMNRLVMAITGPMEVNGTTFSVVSTSP